MKFAATYYLLLIYLTVMLQPLIPIAEDALFHCFAEAYHVATVHAKYGNNHVDIELGKNEKDDNKNQPSIKSFETLAHIIPAISTSTLSLKKKSARVFSCRAEQLVLGFINRYFQPPKFQL